MITVLSSLMLTVTQGCREDTIDVRVSGAASSNDLKTTDPQTRTVVYRFIDRQPDGLYLELGNDALEIPVRPAATARSVPNSADSAGVPTAVPKRYGLTPVTVASDGTILRIDSRQPLAAGCYGYAVHSDLTSFIVDEQALLMDWWVPRAHFHGFETKAAGVLCVDGSALLTELHDMTALAWEVSPAETFMKLYLSSDASGLGLTNGIGEVVAQGVQRFTRFSKASFKKIRSFRDMMLDRVKSSRKAGAVEARPREAGAVEARPRAESTLPGIDVVTPRMAKREAKLFDPKTIAGLNEDLKAAEHAEQLTPNPQAWNVLIEMIMGRPISSPIGSISGDLLRKFADPSKPITFSDYVQAIRPQSKSTDVASDLEFFDGQTANIQYLENALPNLEKSKIRQLHQIFVDADFQQVLSKGPREHDAMNLEDTLDVGIDLLTAQVLAKKFLEESKKNSLWQSQEIIDDLVHFQSFKVTRQASMKSEGITSVTELLQKNGYTLSRLVAGGEGVVLILNRGDEPATVVRLTKGIIQEPDALQKAAASENRLPIGFSRYDAFKTFKGDDEIERAIAVYRYAGSPSDSGLLKATDQGQQFRADATPEELEAGYDVIDQLLQRVETLQQDNLFHGDLNWSNAVRDPKTGFLTVIDNANVIQSIRSIEKIPQLPPGTPGRQPPELLTKNKEVTIDGRVLVKAEPANASASDLYAVATMLAELELRQSNQQILRAMAASSDLDPRNATDLDKAVKTGAYHQYLKDNLPKGEMKVLIEQMTNPVYRSRLTDIKQVIKSYQAIRASRSAAPVH